jgi:hypothetical protein
MVDRFFERSWLGQVQGKSEHGREPYFAYGEIPAELLTMELGKSLLKVCQKQTAERPASSTEGGVEL